MNILFISYWGIEDGLTQATVVPHVRLLSSFPEVKKIILCTIEREKFRKVELPNKIEHIPLFSKNYSNVLLNKVNDFLSFTKQVGKLTKVHGIKLIICRSSLAGGIGHRVSMKTTIPYVVESFEPHASYMLESGVWRKFDPRYWVEIYFQKKQRVHAHYLLPVAANYANELIRKGVKKEKIIVVPCVVDLDLFYRRNDQGHKINLNIANGTVIGIYAGKFGGLYYDREAFQIFAHAKKVFRNFCLIILTPSNKSDIEVKLNEEGFLKEDYRLMKVNHSEVINYLSISDFAFATYKPSASKKYLSPIKIGEYWACGLPVLLTDGVGDDAAIIESTKTGAVFSLEKKTLNQALEDIKNQLSDAQVWTKNRQLAEAYRNPDILYKAYKTILADLRML